MADAFGNALGNSIVEGMSKEAAIVDRLAKRGFKGEFDPSGYGNSALDNLTLEDLSGPSLSSNPSNAVYQPAMALTADEQRNGTIDPVAAMELQREIAREEAGRGYAVSGGMGQEAQWPTDPAILAQYDRWADINAKNGPLAIEVTRGAEEEAGLLSRVAQGAGHAAVDLVTQPFAQLHDLGAIGYDIFDNTFLGDQSSPNYWSNIGRYEQSGEVTTEGRILNLVGAVPVLNVGAMTYQGTTSLMNGDYGALAEQVGGLGVGFATGGVISRYGNRSLQSPLTFELQRGAVAYSGLPIGVRSPLAPTGDYYSVAFQMTLDSPDLGTSRPVHFNRANAALDAALQANAEFATSMERLIPGVSQDVSRVGGRTTPEGWVWHHDQEVGVMQLVPSSQHTQVRLSGIPYILTVAVVTRCGQFLPEHRRIDGYEKSRRIEHC